MRDPASFKGLCRDSYIRTTYGLHQVVALRSLEVPSRSVDPSLREAMGGQGLGHPSAAVSPPEELKIVADHLVCPEVLGGF